MSAGLEPQQHQLLLAVKGTEDTELPTIVHLAERLQIRHHSVVGLVDRLEQRGLVKRRRDTEDHRRVIIDLTPEGEILLAELSQFHEEELRDMAPELLAALRSIIDSPVAPTKGDA